MSNVKWKVKERTIHSSFVVPRSSYRKCYVSKSVLKSTLPGLRQILAIEIPLKMIKVLFILP